MKVDITTQPDFSVGSPLALCEFSADYVAAFRGYDIAPDGQKFLSTDVSEYVLVEVTKLNLVLNWFDELRRLAPPGRK